MNNYLNKRNCCPVCKSNNKKTLHQVDYSDPTIRLYLSNFYINQGSIDYELIENNKYCILECLNCQLIYQEEIPNEELMNIIYEKWIDATIAKNLNQSFSVKNILKKIYNTQEILKILVYINQKPNKLNFFDFGAGWCNWLSICKKIGINSYCSEVSSSRLEHALALGINIVDWSNLNNYRFDFINCEQVLEHIQDPLETLIKLTKSLSTNGILKISVPDASVIPNRISINTPEHILFEYNAIAPLEHINAFNYNSLIHLANLAGLSEINDSRLLCFSPVHFFRFIKNPTTGLKPNTYLYFKLNS